MILDLLAETILLTRTDATHRFVKDLFDFDWERQQGCPSTCWILSQRNESQTLDLSEGSSKRLLLNR